VTIGRHATGERVMTSEQQTEREGTRVAELGEGASPQILTFGSPTVGEVLAERYQLEEHIGNDSLGRQLYRGIDVILRRPVAVVLRYPGGDSAREMLGAAVAASRIVHPHLVGVYDAIDEGDRAYVVREWVEGIALRDVVSAGPLDAARAVAVAWAVTDAVAALHATGMAHGNIHPGTVLVAHDGRVVLTDARTDDAATPETDIRSIGAVLYCALTGYWPQAEVGHSSVPDAVRDSNGVIAAPRQVRAGVPTHLDQLTTDLLNPNLPLPPADALAAELASFGQTEEDIVYAGDSPDSNLDFDAFDSASQSTSSPKPIGRKLAVGVVGLLVLALAGTLAAARVLGGDASGQSPTTPGGSGKPQAGASAPVKQQPSGVPAEFKLTADQLRIVAPKRDRDNDKDVGNMVDGNSTTTWRTQSYKNQKDFGGDYKPGLGVLIDLKTPQQVASVQVDFTTGGAAAELRTGTSDPGAGTQASDPNANALDTQLVSSFQVVGDPTQDTGTRAVFAGPAEPTRYLLIWITKLPSDGKGGYRIGISQITVKVQN
jgi:serine/threonine protein kinase